MQKRILITGAAGGMGFESLKQLVNESDKSMSIVALDLFTDKNVEKLEALQKKKDFEIYWGSKKAWEKLPEKVSEMEHFTDWDKVVHIDHGYDESKPEEELSLEDMKRAAEFKVNWM